MSRAVTAGQVVGFADGSIDPQSAALWLQSRGGTSKRQPARPRGGKVRSGTPRRGSLAAAQAKVARINARLLELRLDRERGKVLDADEVRATVQEVARRVRDLLLSVPGRLAATCFGAASEKDVFDTLEREMRHVCGELARMRDLGAERPEPPRPNGADSRAAGAEPPAA